MVIEFLLRFLEGPWLKSSCLVLLKTRVQTLPGEKIFSCFSKSLQAMLLFYFLKGRNSFRPSPFQFIDQNNPIIRD
jgi:hypothetical protein